MALLMSMIVIMIILEQLPALLQLVMSPFIGTPFVSFLSSIRCLEVSIYWYV